MHVYIAPEQGNSVLRRFTVLLSLIQTCFHDNISPPGASNPRPLRYDSYSLTNCAIGSRHIHASSDVFVYARACECVCTHVHAYVCVCVF